MGAAFAMTEMLAVLATFVAPRVVADRARPVELGGRLAAAVAGNGMWLRAEPR